jgi:rhodanese-related sulfurtransferase
MIASTPQEAYEWHENDQAILIDVREHHEVEKFSIPGALVNPMSSFDITAIPKESGKRLVFFCAHGMRSQQIGQYLLQENIITEAYNMTGGAVSWKNSGLPGDESTL